MAEALLKAAPQAAGWVVQSAGTWAADGMPACDSSRVAVRRFGLDISRHRSRRLTHAIAAESELLVALARDHYDHIVRCFPFAREKTLLLGSFLSLGRNGDADHDIDDPIGAPPATYATTCATIARAISRLATYLEEFP